MKTMQLLGVLTPTTAAVAEPAGKPPLSMTVLPAGVLGVGAALKMKDHPFLGFIGGESIGMNAYRVWRGKTNDRRVAFTNMGQAAAIIGGSLMWKKHPFWGGVLGLAAGVAAMSFVPGSNANKLFHK